MAILRYSKLSPEHRFQRQDSQNPDFTAAESQNPESAAESTIPGSAAEFQNPDFSSRIQNSESAADLQN